MPEFKESTESRSGDARQPIEVVEVGNVLGECILWDDRRQAAWWTDIEQRTLYCYQRGQRKWRQWPTPERLASFGLTTRDDCLVAAFESGFALYEPETTRLEWLARPVFRRGRMRMNDGRVDRQGRFWAGAMHEQDPLKGAPAAKLYCLGTDRRLSEHEKDIHISNALCWSPDGRIMYFADSPSGEIRAYDFDSRRGTISNRRQFAVTRAPGLPDGSTVDTDGCVWNAQWGAGRVVRYTPDGKEAFVLPVPASQPTCVAFGGPSLTQLFVTSARQGLPAPDLAKQPAAGHLFIYETGIRGLPEPRFPLT